LDKILEQVISVVRARRSLWMILDGEYRQVLVTYPSDGAIVQIQVADFHNCIG
jgi:hypothetical protein